MANFMRSLLKYGFTFLIIIIGWRLYSSATSKSETIFLSARMDGLWHKVNTYFDRTNIAGNHLFIVANIAVKSIVFYKMATKFQENRFFCFNAHMSVKFVSIVLKFYGYILRHFYLKKKSTEKLTNLNSVYFFYVKFDFSALVILSKLNRN